MKVDLRENEKENVASYIDLVSQNKNKNIVSRCTTMRCERKALSFWLLVCEI